MTEHNAAEDWWDAADIVIDYFTFARMLKTQGRHPGSYEKTQGIRAASRVLGGSRSRNHGVMKPPGVKIKAHSGYEVEHAVPVSVIVKMVDATDLSHEAIIPVLQNYLVVFYIRKADHARLGSMGLGRSMPADWDGLDPLARYKAAGIDLTGYAPESELTR
jgi:hypothetical protein